MDGEIVKVWTTLTDDALYDIANAVGVSIACGQSVNRTRTPIDKVGRAYSFSLRPTEGKDEHGNRQYQRISASAWSSGRRVFAVCWHGHRDFMRAIFEHDPNARIKSYVADYKGRDDFERNFGQTGFHNIGSMMYPMFMKDACVCNDTINGSYAVSMSQQMLQGCPFVIFDPEHYRADGTCKCDDPQHRVFMKREWEYTDADFKGIPLRHGA